MVDTTFIDRAQKAREKADRARERADEAFRDAVLSEAARLVQERLEKDHRRDAARAGLASISATESQLEQDNAKHRANYEQADYEGNGDAAQHHQDAGEVARTRLKEVRQQRDEAARVLDAASFDVDHEDDAFRHEIQTLKALIPEDERDELARLMYVHHTRPVSEAMRQRAEARQEAERREQAERRERLLDPVRDAHGVARIPKGGIRDPETGKRIA